MFLAGRGTLHTEHNGMSSLLRRCEQVIKEQKMGSLNMITTFFCFFCYQLVTNQWYLVYDGACILDHPLIFAICHVCLF